MENLSPLQLGLLEKGIIDLQGEVNENMIEYLRECMMRLATKDNPPIYVKITSDGGDTSISFTMNDILRLYPGHKTGTVIGFARSAAVTILQACDRREAARNSWMLIHHPKFGAGMVGLDEIDNPKKWGKHVGDLRATQKQLHLILAEKTKKSQRAIAALCKEDRDLSAEEALKFGLIDAIV